MYDFNEYVKKYYIKSYLFQHKTNFYENSIP
jgi:hypothetical protein